MTASRTFFLSLAAVHSVAPAFCLAIFMVPVFAQSDRGTLTGTLTDPQGAVIPNAKLTAVNADTSAEYGTVSTATGNYTIAELPAGSYQLLVNAPASSASNRGTLRFRRRRLNASTS